MSRHAHVRGRATKLHELGPGLMAAAVVAALARLATRLLPPPFDPLDEVIIAVFLGMLAANVLRIPRLAAGLRFTSTRLLQAGIILLGLKLSLGEIGRLGASTVLVIVLMMIVAVTAVAVVSQTAPIGFRQGALIAVGTAICGNSAIAASASTIGASEGEVARAIAANTLVGTVALFIYPVLGQAAGATPTEFGSWAGVAINDTSQVVAAGFAHSDRAGEAATTIKLVRNALMAPALVALALVFRRSGGEPLTPRAVRQAVPGFVLLFLLAAAATSIGLTDAVDTWLPFSIENTALAASRTMILLALGAVGLSTPLAQFRQGGGSVMLAAAAAGSCVAVVGYLLMVPLGLGA